MYAQEAVNELVDNMTKPKFAGKLVIILAGYDKDMNNLLSVNEGLSSRFADEIIFPSLGPDDCLKLLEGELKNKEIAFPSMHDKITYQQLLEPISELSKLPSWGNARDVQTLAKSMIRAVFLNNTSKVDQLSISSVMAIVCIQNMLFTRLERVNSKPAAPASFPGATQSLDKLQSAPRTSLTTSTATRVDPKPMDPDESQRISEVIDDSEQRDAGVSDAIWAQLQKDKKQAELQAQEMKHRLEKQEAAAKLAEEKREEAEEVATELQKKQAEDEAERHELLRLREEARIREMKAKDERDRIRQELERQRQIAEENRKQEAKAQRKLREMGVCCAGFRWIKQTGGYRCAGGTHWVTDSQLGI